MRGGGGYAKVEIWGASAVAKRRLAETRRACEAGVDMRKLKFGGFGGSSAGRDVAGSAHISMTTECLAPDASQTQSVEPSGIRLRPVTGRQGLLPGIAATACQAAPAGKCGASAHAPCARFSATQRQRPPPRSVMVGAEATGTEAGAEATGPEAGAERLNR